MAFQVGDRIRFNKSCPAEYRNVVGATATVVDIRGDTYRLKIDDPSVPNGNYRDDAFWHIDCLEKIEAEIPRASKADFLKINREVSGGSF